ncbi:MAG: transposase [Turicibacter sp.]
MVADAGYESEENYHYLEEHQLKDYIKPLNDEQTKQKKFKQNLGKRENMTYLEEEDVYLCANKKKLHSTQVLKKETKSGYIKEETIYECENCENCLFKPNCTTDKGNKKLSVSKEFITYREKSLENLKSDDGRGLRVNRSIQVEGAFGVLKQNMGFKRFFSRGLKNVTLEFYLLAFAYNIQKFHQKNQNDRLGHHLHELKKT